MSCVHSQRSTLLFAARESIEIYYPHVIEVVDDVSPSKSNPHLDPYTNKSSTSPRPLSSPPCILQVNVPHHATDRPEWWRSAANVCTQLVLVSCLRDSRSPVRRFTLALPLVLNRIPSLTSGNSSKQHPLTNYQIPTTPTLSTWL
jgi:hypothetical protein